MKRIKIPFKVMKTPRLSFTLCAFVYRFSPAALVQSTTHFLSFTYKTMFMRMKFRLVYYDKLSLVCSSLFSFPVQRIPRFCQEIPNVSCYHKTAQVECFFQNKVEKERGTLELLQNPEAGYDLDQALVLCQMNNFKAGILYLYEKAKL